MSEDDVLFGYRLQLLDYASRTTVSEACRTFGVHRSTYYRWKRLVERHGLEVLRPRERRSPKMPNQLPAMVEERIVAFAIAHPGYGPRRVASELRREKWGGIVVSQNGVWRCLRRHGLNTRLKRLSWSPATARRTSRRAILRPSRISRSTIPASWSASTASTWAGSEAPPAPSGS
jgi:transposase